MHNNITIRNQIHIIFSYTQSFPKGDILVPFTFPLGKEHNNSNLREKMFTWLTVLSCNLSFVGMSRSPELEADSCILFIAKSNINVCLILTLLSLFYIVQNFLPRKGYYPQWVGLSTSINAIKKIPTESVRSLPLG